MSVGIYDGLCVAVIIGTAIGWESPLTLNHINAGAFGVLRANGKSHKRIGRPRKDESS